MARIRDAKDVIAKFGVAIVSSSRKDLPWKEVTDLLAYIRGKKNHRPLSGRMMAVCRRINNALALAKKD